jgi:O-antigen/teichoic acid export membrane protein
LTRSLPCSVPAPADAVPVDARRTTEPSPALADPPRPVVSRRRAAVASMLGSAGGVVVVAVQSLVLTPLFLRYVGQRLYGAWLGSGDVLLWLQAFDLGIPNVLIQRLGAAHGRGDDAEAGRWLASGTVSLVILGILIGAGGVAVAGMLPRWFDVAGADAGHLSSAFALGSVSVGMLMVSHIGLAWSRGVQRTGLFSAVQVLATLAAFAVTLVLLLAGLRLMAIAWGFVARSVVLLAGAGVVLVRDVPASTWRTARPDRRTLQELGRLMPITALGGLSFAAMSQSELAIIGAMLDPMLAAAYMATRRASELARALVDTISWSTYGAFAHLAGSSDRPRAMHSYREIFAVRDAASVALAAAFIAANGAFVGAWVGPELYMGLLLTTLIGIQAVVTGGAFLANYLYRAAGAVATGSALLFAEAVLRVTLAVLLIRAGAGVLAIPVAAIITAVMSWTLVRRWTVAALGDPAPPPRWHGLWMWVARAALIAVAVGAAAVAGHPGWVRAAVLAAVFGAGGLVTLIALDPAAASLRQRGATLIRWRRNSL